MSAAISAMPPVRPAGRQCRRERRARRRAARSTCSTPSMASTAWAATSRVSRPATIICCRHAGCSASRPTSRFPAPLPAHRPCPRPRPARRVMRRRSSFPARCAAGSATRQILAPRIGCSTPPAASLGATTSSPARRSPAHRPAAPRCRGRWRICSWCRAWAASPAPAWSSLCRRTGWRGSNICSPITATAASRFRPAHSVSTRISTSANCVSASTTGSTAIRTRATPLSQRRCRSSTISPSTARPLISVNMSSRSVIPISARTASRPTRAARPGTPPRFLACGCGRAPSFGSIRRSIRALV